MPFSYTHLSRKSLLLLASFVWLLGGCTFSRMVKKAERGQKITVQPEVLMVRGQQVPVEVQAQLPENLLRKDYRYAIKVYFQADKGVEQHVGSLGFDFGEYTFQDLKPTMARTFTFPYSPSKATGKLMAQGIVTNPKKKQKYTKPLVLAPGIITTPHLVQHAYAATYVDEEYKNEKPGPATFTIYFDQGLATLRQEHGTNIKLLDEFIRSNQKTHEVNILASHSPDQTESEARNLASRRAVAVERYFRQKLETEYYTASASSVKFSLKALNKHWDAFLGRVQNSAMPEEEIQDILDIVNGTGSFAEKEEKLQKLPSYDYLETYVYPVLRYAQLTIDYQPDLRRDYEIYLLAKKIVENRADADALTPEEMQYAATLTPLLAEKKKIYEATVQTTMHWRALNNLGMVYYEQAQKELKPKVKKALLESAILNFRYAAHRQPTAQLFYNLAIAHHQHGDYLEAMQSYDYAVKLGGPLPVLQTLFADKAALELEVGQYDDAAASLAYAGNNYTAQFNRALLYFLKGNYEGAASFAQKVLDTKPQDAPTHYLLAVIGARTKDENLLSSHLKQAVTLEPTYAGKAIDDLEFINYHKKEPFTSALRR